MSGTRVHCSDKRCSRELREIEIKDINYDDYDVNDNDCDVKSTKLQIADDGELTSTSSDLVDLEAHAALCARKESNTSNSWEGDWNKYWNNKSDY